MSQDLMFLPRRLGKKLKCLSFKTPITEPKQWVVSGVEVPRQAGSRSFRLICQRQKQDAKRSLKQVVKARQSSQLSKQNGGDVTQHIRHPITDLV